MLMALREVRGEEVRGEEVRGEEAGVLQNKQK